MSEPMLPPAVVGLHDALITFTGCIGESLDDICSYGLTIGESYVPFDPDPEDECEEDEVACSQSWVRVTGVNPTYQQPSFEGAAGCTSELEVGIEVGILRCFDIEEGGEAPTASDVLLGAMQAMTDMNAIFCAAMGCEVWTSISPGNWIPSGPTGGQYGGTWTFTVQL